jgi:molybdopterin synthase catalytic subunit
MSRVHVRVQRSDFDLRDEVDQFTNGTHDVGAVVTFTGLCRDEGGTLAALELEHYPGMAEAELTKICNAAIARFNLKGLTAIHRFGKIAAGDNIVLVIAAASHRQEAFDGANFVMDYLKTSAPFWKKEHGTNGRIGDWIDAKDSDQNARERWR